MSRSVFSNPSASAASSSGGLSPTVTCSAFNASCSLWRLCDSCRNVASSAIGLPACQSLVKVLGQNLGPRQATVEGHAYGANQKTLRNNSRIDARCQTARGFFDHLLFLAAKIQDLGQTAIAKSAIGLITHRIHSNRTSFIKRFQHRRRYASRRWIRINPHPSL